MHSEYRILFINQYLLIIIACGAVFSAATHSAAQSYDFILRNAHIVDGTGTPWCRGEVAVNGDTIARIATSIPGDAKRVIDVRGQVVAPGFVEEGFSHVIVNGQAAYKNAAMTAARPGTVLYGPCKAAR